MHVSFEHCGQIERCGLAEQPIQHGPLRCRHCGTLISTIDVIIMRKFGHLPRREQWKRGMSYIWKKFRTVILSICVVGGIIVLGFLAANYGKMEALIGRQGSTFGHIERFVIGTLRFADRPW